MKIIIAGAGEVGNHLAKMLSGGHHDITVIDADARLLDDVEGMSDIVTIEGAAPLSPRSGKPPYARPTSSSR